MYRIQFVGMVGTVGKLRLKNVFDVKPMLTKFAMS